MEGIWYAHFTSGPAHGDGLAVLRNGIIQGGDPEHTYEGFYQEDGVDIYANVRVAPCAKGGHISDIDHPFSVFLKGSVTGDRATVSGHPDNHPELMVAVELFKGA